MRTNQEIHEDIAYHAKSLEKLVNTREADNRPFTAEERKEATEHEAAIVGFEKELAEIRDTEADVQRLKGRLESVRKPATRQVPPMQPSDDNSVSVKTFEVPGHVPANLKVFRDANGSARAAKDGFMMAAYLAEKFWKAPWAIRRMKEIRDNGYIRAHNEGNVNQGGAFVPDQFANYMIRNVEEYGIWLKESFVVPMTSDYLVIPRRVSGLTTYNVGEGVATTESTSGYDNVTLTAKKLGVLALYSSELAEDAALPVVDLLMDDMALSAAQKLDEVGFTGDGSNSDFGIQGLLGKIEALSSSYWAQARNVPVNTYAEIDADSLGLIQSQVAEFAKPNGKFYGSPMAIEVGVGGTLQGLGGATVAEVSGGVPMRFNGYPCVKSHFLREGTGAVTDDLALIFFGDLRKASTTGLRRSFEIAESRDIKFLEDQIALRGTLRFDINIHDLGGLTSGGHTTKGPICALMSDAA